MTILLRVSYCLFFKLRSLSKNDKADPDRLSFLTSRVQLLVSPNLSTIFATINTINASERRMAPF